VPRQKFSHIPLRVTFVQEKRDYNAANRGVETPRESD
ncbi:hypothetical protein A2U01_0089870, partial [Trifolium medium]|nr:hypothetical protein [Trifolium medium]